MQIGIVGHISRNDEAHALKDRLDAEVINVDDGDFFSIWDATRRCAENHIKVLSQLLDISAGKSDWLVVFEDDALPIPGFRTEAAAALKHSPSPLVGLYLGTGNPSGSIQRAIGEAIHTAGPWLTADFFISGVGYAIRADLAAGMLEDIKQRDDELPLRITRWSQGIGLLTSYTHPSLCDHADIISTIAPAPDHERAKMPRRAWDVGGRKSWDGEPVRLPKDPLWSASFP